MIVGRTTKDSATIRRVTVDFTTNGWLDTGETISGVTTPVVVVEQQAVWYNGALSTTPIPPPVDSAPLVVNSITIIGSSTMVQLMLGVGTPGLTYKVTFVATGTSGREEQIDLLVMVRTPP